MKTKKIHFYECDFDNAEVRIESTGEWIKLADFNDWNELVEACGGEENYKNGCHWIECRLKRRILVDVSGSGFGSGNPGIIAVTEVVLDPECEITVKGYEKDDFTGTIYSFDGSSFYPGELSLVTERIIEEQK